MKCSQTMNLLKNGVSSYYNNFFSLYITLIKSNRQGRKTILQLFSGYK